MLALRELQAGFAGYILDQEAPALIEEVNAASLTRERRLNVYRNNVFTSLSAALASLYPAVQALVGEEFFQQLCKRYVKEHPSRTGDLHDFGESFADYLQSIEQLAQLPYLPGVATLEWHYHVVFHAADAAPFDMSKLQTVAPEDYANIQFMIHPATRLVRSPYPVLDIWRFTQASDDITFDLDKGAQQIAVRRRNSEMDFQLLKPSDFLFLELMQSGKALAEIETAMETGLTDPKGNYRNGPDSHDYDLQMLLISQVQNGNIVDVMIPS